MMLEPEDKEKRSALSRTKQVRRNWSLRTDSTEESFSLWKGLFSQGYGFSSGHVWMWELTIKKAEHWRIDAFELWCWRRLLRVPWTARRSNQSILKEISPECSLEGTEAETPILWPPHAKSWLIWKDPDAGKDWGQEEKGKTEDEMAGWHHRLNGHEFG